MKGLTTGIVLCTLSASVSAQPEYTVVDLGSFGGDIAAVDINDAGVVVGWGVVNRFDYQMFRYDGVLTAIAPLQPQTQAQATLASVDGSVVGAGYSMTDLDRDALVSDGVNTVSPGMFTPTGSDSSGRLVGITPVTLANGFVIEHACEYSDGTLSVLPLLPGGADSAAFDTDDSGWIVGGAFPAGALKPTPALWVAQTPTNLGTLGGTGGQAHAINNARQVVGWANTAAGQPHAFRYNLSGSGAVTSRTDLGTLDGKASHARDINDAGEVVGTSGSHAFIYRSGQMIDLNSLIDPASGWVLVDAKAINNAGQIVGHGSIPGHPLRAFLLEPGVCLADTNGDGVLSPADFSAWVVAFNNAAPACDQNGDGNCTPADFSAWIANYNAGCQ